MIKIRPIALAVTTALSLLAAGGCTTTASTSTASSGNPVTGRSVTGKGPIADETKREIDQGYRQTLERLYETTPGSRELVAKSRGVLVFPKVYAAGFVVGGEYGEGELRVANDVAGYYRSSTCSLGLQFCAQY